MRNFKIVVLVFVFMTFTTCTFARNAAYVGTKFENISLGDFIKFISARTHINITYSQSSIPPTVKITLYSSKVLSNKDLLKIFYSILKENRLVPIREDNTILIVRASSVRNVGGSFTNNIYSPGNTLSTTVVQLKNVSVDRLGIPLRRLVSPFGSLDIIPNINTIVITDTKDRLRQIVKLLKRIDMSDQIVTRLIPIKNASSSSVAQELNRFFRDLKVQKGLAYSPVILSENASNSLLIAARRADFGYINSVVKKIAKKVESERTQRVFYLKNAVAKDVYNVIVKLLSKTPAFRGTSISYDEATNSILVLGTPSVYDRVKSLIKKLDVPRKQVYIEALIMETSASNLSEFGVEWSAVGKHRGAIGYAGSSNTGNLANLENAIVGQGKLAPLPNGFSLGILGNVITYNGVRFATLGALLNAVKSNNSINIVSNPKIVTLDNQKATIFVGENRPFLTSQKYDINGHPIYTYDYKNIGVKLSILPHVNGKKIILDTSLDITKVTQNVVVGNSVAPVTLSRTTTTKISLDSGDKILISGLIENDNEKVQQSVPILSSIPILGGLFRYEKTTRAKTNLLIFLSVRVVNNNQKGVLMKVNKDKNG